MPELEYVVCSDGVIRLEIPPYPTVIKENLYPAELDEEVYYPEEGRMRKLLYRYYHPDSFRRVPIWKRKDEEIIKEYGLLIACPIDKWNEKTGRCGVATRALQIWHPYERLDELLWRCHLSPDNRESLAYKRRHHVKNILKDIKRIKKVVPVVAGLGTIETGHCVSDCIIQIKGEFVTLISKEHPQCELLCNLLKDAKESLLSIVPRKRGAEISFITNYFWNLHDEGILTENHVRFLTKALYSMDRILSEKEGLGLGEVEMERRLAKEVETLKRPYLRKWYVEGVKAGREDTWMADPKSVYEDVELIIEREGIVGEEYVNYLTDAISFFQDAWSETDHFRVKYGSKMWTDARKILDVAITETDIRPEFEQEWIIDIYRELEDEFWRGFHESFDTYSVAEKAFKDILFGRSL